MSAAAVPGIPLMPGAWRTLGVAEQAAFRRRLLWSFDRPDAQLQSIARSSNLRAMPLSFYPGWFLIESEAQVGDDMLGTVDLLYGPGLFAVIDGDSGLIHDLNAGHIPRAVRTYRQAGSRGADDPLHPDDRLASPLVSQFDAQITGPDYLRFFCSSVWGQEGPFMVIESPASPLLAGIDLAEREWADQLRPLAMTADGSDLLAQAVVAYGGKLFSARFRLQGRMVLMEDDQPLDDVQLPPQHFMAPFRHLRPLR